MLLNALSSCLALGRHLHDHLVAVDRRVDRRHLALAEGAEQRRADRRRSRRRACWRGRGRSSARPAGRAAASRWSRRGTSGRRASAPAACSAQSFSSSACTLCRMYWYCALLCRPPSCRFWIGRMKTAMPGTSRSLRRRPSITCFIGWRSARGFRLMNMRPVFCALLPPPLNELTVATFGSARTISATRLLQPHHRRERGVLRRLGRDADLADVLLREEALRDRHEQPRGGDEGQQRDEQPTARDGAARRRACACRRRAARRRRARTSAPARPAASCGPRRSGSGSPASAPASARRTPTRRSPARRSPRTRGTAGRSRPA